MDTVLCILEKLRSNLRGRVTLSGPLYFLKPFLSHRQLIALYRRFSITLRFCDQFWWLTGCTALWILLNISTNMCRLEPCHSSIFLWLPIGLISKACKILSLFCMSHVFATSWNVQTIFLSPSVFITESWYWLLFWITINQLAPLQQCTETGYYKRYKSNDLYWE